MTTPQPPFDSDEPWTELEPLKRVPVMAVWDLVEALRAAGIPVLGRRPRRSGLFTRGLLDVRLSVPERLAQEARLIVVERLGVR